MQTEVHILESALLRGAKVTDPPSHIIWTEGEYDFWRDTPAGISFWILNEKNEWELLSRTPQEYVLKVWTEDVRPSQPAPAEAPASPSYAPLADDYRVHVDTYAHHEATPLGLDGDLTYEHAVYTPDADPSETLVTRPEEERDIDRLQRVVEARRPGESRIEIKSYLNSLLTRESPLVQPLGSGVAAESVHPLAADVHPDSEGKPRRTSPGEDTALLFPVIVPPTHSERIPDDE